MTTAMANRLKRLETASGVGGDDKTGFLAIAGPTEELVVASWQSLESRYPNRAILPMPMSRLSAIRRELSNGG
jgi:hypothetical protein